MFKYLFLIILYTSSIFPSDPHSNRSHSFLDLMWEIIAPSQTEITTNPRNLIDAVQAGKLAETVCFLQNGADPNQTLVISTAPNIPLEETITAPLITYATLHGLSPLLTLLIQQKSKINLNATSSQGKTALMYATFSNKPEIARCLQLLLKAKANTDAVDRDGKTALWHATDNENEDAVTTLLQAKANPNTVNPAYSQYPLEVACYKGSFAIAQKLILAGATINAQNKSGLTPLMSATMGGNHALVELLLKYNADTTIKDWTGWTAIDYLDAAPDKTKKQRKNKSRILNLLQSPRAPILNYEWV